MTRSRLLTYLLTVTLVLLFGVGAASALHGDKVVSGTNNASIYRAGQNVDITGTVNGDVYCAAQTVTVNATVNGDVLCAGQTVTVNGTVHGNVRVAGQTVTINAQVDRAVSTAAQTSTVQSGAKVGGDITVFGRTSHIDGQVGRDIRGGTEDMTIAGQVGRNVEANVDYLELENGSRVAGNVDYTGHHSVDQNRGAVVNGKIVQHQPQQQAHHHNAAAFWLLFGLYFVVTALVFAMVMVALFPWFFREAAVTARSWPWVELLIGFLASLLVPAIIFVLFATLIGVPLGILLGLFWIAASLVSGTITAYWVGHLVLRRESHPAPLVMLVGALILILLYLIPFLDFIIIPLAYWIGLGMLLRYLWGNWRHPVYHEQEVVHSTPTRGRTRKATE
jgi:cytoskeletal protein CcmA (bactofilin family)